MSARVQYIAYQYDADGHQSADLWSQDCYTLDEARAAICEQMSLWSGTSREADIALLSPYEWDGGDDDIEAYHSMTEEQIQASGLNSCGGYAIRVAPTNDIAPMG